MFNDLTCDCGKRIGIQGELPDYLTCPACKKVMDLRELKAELERVEKELLDDED